MNYFKILTILLLSSVISFYSCSDNSDAVKKEAREKLNTSDVAAQPNAVAPNPATVEPPQNADGVWHYTCNAGCAGGAGSAEKCTTCGGILAHNQAYHGKGNADAKANIGAPNVVQPVTPPPTVEPAQNAAGVWHYTCGKGCSGGAGSAIACTTCGGTLAHNQGYH